MIGKRTSSILFAIADWGIGHATRSAVVMEWLLDQGFDLHVASSGRALHWLQKRFPGLAFEILPPYRVRYPTASVEANILLNAPRLWRAVSRENRQIRSWAQQHGPVLLLSDCRFGAYISGIPSVYLTHQFHVAPGKIPGAHRLVSAWQHRLIRQYSECWVPDFPTGPSLSGSLSHPKPLGLDSVFYIGPLSDLPRVKPKTRFQIVALLSGPEPQRSHLEKKLVPQLVELNLPALIIRGRPEKERSPERRGCLTLVNWSTASKIAGHLRGAQMVVARSGYSTLMDLEGISVPCLLVPTPGQTEQEYLAQQRSSHPGVAVQRQRDLNVKQAFHALQGISRAPVQRSPVDWEQEPLWQGRIISLLSR